MNAECRYASALLRIPCIRVSSFSFLKIAFCESPSALAEACETVGFQVLSANSIACEAFSNSVLRTEALLVWPATVADSSEFLRDSKWDNRWMIGHRSVERPRRVSTELSGELGTSFEWAELGTGKGGAVD